MTSGSIWLISRHFNMSVSCKFSCSNFTDLVFITKIQGIGIVLFLKDLTDAFLLSEFILV